MITINTPNADADPAVHLAHQDMIRRELTIMFAESVAECKRLDDNVKNLTATVARLAEDTERAMRDHGLLNSSGIMQATGPALDMAAASRDVAYRNLKVQVHFTNNAYGHDVSRELLKLVGGLDLENHELLDFIEGKE